MATNKSKVPPEVSWWVIGGLSVLFFGLLYSCTPGCAAPREVVAERTAQLDERVETVVEPVADFNPEDEMPHCRKILGPEVSLAKCAEFVGYERMAASDDMSEP